MPFIHADPVALPGLAALVLGFFAFVVALFAARARVAKAGKAEIRQRAPAAWLWVVVQGIGIAVAGFGPIRVLLDPGSPKAIVEGVAVFALMFGAVGLVHAASRTMGKNWAVVARTREDHTLVQEGPFRWVRHPIYVALFFFMVAMAIAYGHVANLLAGVPIYAIGTWLRIRHEERLLRGQFGAAYDAYAARVKRFVPGLF
jgi:protein-S-isoprenylcysteine O-methyltransferase Ste14